MVCIPVIVKPRGVIVQEEKKAGNTKDKSKGDLPLQICSSMSLCKHQLFKTPPDTAAPSKIKNKIKNYKDHVGVSCR